MGKLCRRRPRELLNALLRIGSVLVTLILEIALLVWGLVTLQRFAAYAYLLLQLCSLPLIYSLVNNEPRYKLNWVLIVFFLPGAGFLLYFLWGSRREFSWFNRRFRRAEGEVCERLHGCVQTEERCGALYPNAAPVGRYLAEAGYPAYACDDVAFFPCGAEMYKRLIPDLQNAKRAIYIEMFILDKGSIWDELFAILSRKVREGVDVRLLLDDFGSLKAATPAFRRRVRETGIRLSFFAPINKDVLHASFNFRTHQKYILIDHEIGYCGGINLADEYFDRIRRFGYWKDTAVRIGGEPVRSMEAMFLVMWQVCTGERSRLPHRVPPPAPAREADCFVRPFAGGPAKNPNNPVQMAYSMMMARARKSLYITTPYLVIDREITESLIRAVHSGVDVRIMMPGIYDKSYVRAVSRQNFGALLKNGVRIFEYEPGFVHAKEMVVDGEMAVCGSINLDFRSLWEHYECGVLFCGGNIVGEIERDILSIQRQSREVTYDQWLRRGTGAKVMETLLCLLAPLM